MSQTEKSFSDHRPGLSPPRFGLRTMLGLIALLCGCLATFVAVGPITGSALLLAVLVVVAHVAGNAIGSQLRQNGSQRTIVDGEIGAANREAVRRPSAHHFAPRTRLSHRAPLGWFMRVMTSLGCVTGAVTGGILLKQTSSRPLPYSTLVFGCIATGVLGGMFAFWLFSLLQVFGLAWWQAHRHGHKKRP